VSVGLLPFIFHPLSFSDFFFIVEALLQLPVVSARLQSAVKGDCVAIVHADP
jgi:hypothetical protein